MIINKNVKATNIKKERCKERCKGIKYRRNNEKF